MEALTIVGRIGVVTLARYPLQALRQESEASMQTLRSSLEEEHTAAVASLEERGSQPNPRRARYIYIGSQRAQCSSSAYASLTGKA